MLTLYMLLANNCQLRILNLTISCWKIVPHEAHFVSETLPFHSRYTGLRFEYKIHILYFNINLDLI